MYHGEDIALVEHAVLTVKGTPATNVVSGASLISLEIDSLDLLEIAMVMEEVSGSTVPSEALEGCRYVDDLVVIAAALTARTGE